MPNLPPDAAAIVPPAPGEPAPAPPLLPPPPPPRDDQIERLINVVGAVALKLQDNTVRLNEIVERLGRLLDDGVRVHR
jgi:hypothetical protein